MKLYLYDHCPFCVRVRMVCGLRQIPVQEIFLLSDDEATPIRLIGAKQVPILTKPDGTHMGESLDIVRYLDEYAGENRINTHIRPEIQTWFDQVSQYDKRLMMPRSIRLGLPEFATQGAVDYFVYKKEQMIGSFAENLANTDELLAKIHADMAQLAVLAGSEQWLNGQDLSMEDVMIFPVLRNLTMTQGIEFPEIISRYVRNMSQKSGVGLYDALAV